MKKSYKIAIGVSAVVVALIGAVAFTNNTRSKETQYTGANKEKAYQAKLNVINPSAYGEVSQLSLEPGSYISIIGQNSSGAFWKQVKSGAKQAIADINESLGYSGDDEVKMSYSGPGDTNSVDEQINILDEELSRYPTALGISIIDASACEVQFELASDNGIPIVSFDAGSDYKDVQSRISTDNTEAATTAAKKLCDEIGDAGQIALFIKDSVSTTSKEREQAVFNEIKNEHPGVEVVKIYYLDDMETLAKEVLGINKEIKEDTSRMSDEEKEALEKEKSEQEEKIASVTQSQIAEYILEKNPQINGIFTSNAATTELAVNACEAKERTDVKIVGFDGGDQQTTYVEEGKVSGLILQNPFGMGYATVVAAARASLNLGNEANVDTGYTWVTKDNIQDANIQKMLY